MSRRLTFLISGAVALAVLAAGVAYGVLRTTKWTSTASVALVPTVKSPTDIANLTSSYNNSGTSGTYVEYLASDDTLKAAGSPDVSVGVRAIPDSRVITVKTEGGEKIVQTALVRLLDAARTNQSQLNDAWTLEILQGAQPAVKSGPSRTLVFGAAVLLAILAGLFVFVVLTRVVGFDAAAAPPRSAAR